MQAQADRLAIAESVVAREEAVSGREFDPSFRATVLRRLAGLPADALLQAQQPEDGLGLSALGDSQADLVYTPVTPCRILDTRITGGALSAGATRSFLVTGTDLSPQGGKATGCGVPYGPATAAVINFVAVSPAGPGNLRVTPFGTAMPLASIINYAAVPGLAIANGPAVALCDPGVSTCPADITIQADASAVDLVADVQGYYRRVMAGGVGTALLADGAVTAAKITDGAVTSAKLATGAVTSAKLATGAVTSAKLAAAAVATANLADGGVTTVKLAAGAVTASLDCTSTFLSASIPASVAFTMDIPSCPSGYALTGAACGTAAFGDATFRTPGLHRSGGVVIGRCEGLNLKTVAITAHGTAVCCRVVVTP